MKTTRKFWLSIALTTLAGCAALDRADLAAASTFTPNENGFVFQSQASTNMQEDSSGAERNRIAVLEGFLERNQVCPNGYRITLREVINRPKTPLGISTLKDIIYRGECSAT